MSRESSSGGTRQPLNRGAVAGTVAVATLLLCAGVGFGVGALIGAAVPLGLAGVFIGFVAGFAVVHARFKDL